MNMHTDYANCAMDILAPLHLRSTRPLLLFHFRERWGLEHAALLHKHGLTSHAEGVERLYYLLLLLHRTISQNTGIVQPMVSVCPHFVDFASLTVNFFNSDLYTRDEAFEAEINAAVREVLSI